MTPTTTAANVAAATQTPAAPMSRDEVKRMLRDAAFVLHLTRRVKAEIMADRPEAPKVTAGNPAEMPAGLGV